MKKKIQLESLLEPLSDLKKLMRQAKCPWMIIGGIAVSLLSKPRFTADIDLVTLIEDRDISNILKLAKKIGFKPRIKDVEVFAQKNRVLLVQHTKSSINIDISLGILPFEIEAIKRSKLCKVGNISLPLPKVEDLIVFKAVAHRPQDIMDINEIVKNNPKINITYLKKIINSFADALDMPEIWLDVKDIISFKKLPKNLN